MFEEATEKVCVECFEEATEKVTVLSVLKKLQRRLLC